MRFLRRVIRIGAACAVAAGALAIAPAAHAQTPTPSGGFGAAPAHPDPTDPATRAYFKASVAPGGTYQDELLVTSTSDTPVQLIVSPVDGLTGQTSGAVYANRDVPIKKAGGWVHPSISALTLAPHDQQLVPFTTTVPAGTTPGDHLAGIAVENANPQRSGGQFAVTEVLRTVVGVEIVVPGPAEPAVQLGKLGLKPVAGTNVASLSIQLGDNGRKLVKPGLTVTLTGPSNYKRRVARQLDTILPGDRIAYPFVWPDSLVRGRYHAVVRATGGAQPVQEQADLNLGTALHGAVHPALPGSGIPRIVEIAAAPALVGLAVLIGWLIARRRRRGRRDAEVRARRRVERYQLAQQAGAAPRRPTPGVPPHGDDRQATSVR
jgi:hypothetical protein